VDSNGVGKDGSGWRAQELCVSCGQRHIEWIDFVGDESVYSERAKRENRGDGSDSDAGGSEKTRVGKQGQEK
jgi:hypothetical protein